MREKVNQQNKNWSKKKTNYIIAKVQVQNRIRQSIMASPTKKIIQFIQLY